jgi:hypothetical protein
MGRESGLGWRHNRPTIPSESTETGSRQTAPSSGESSELPVLGQTKRVTLGISDVIGRTPGRRPMRTRLSDGQLRRAPPCADPALTPDLGVTSFFGARPNQGWVLRLPLVLCLSIQYFARVGQPRQARSDAPNSSPPHESHQHPCFAAARLITRNCARERDRVTSSRTCPTSLARCGTYACRHSSRRTLIGDGDGEQRRGVGMPILSPG